MTNFFLHCEREVKSIVLSLCRNKLVNDEQVKPVWNIIVAKMGPTKTVIITLPCDRFWLTKLKGYHNPSSWQNFADQNEGWS